MTLKSTAGNTASLDELAQAHFGASRPAGLRRWRWVRRIVAVGIIAVVTVVIAEYAGQWKDRFIPRQFRVVEPGQVFASGQIDRHLIRQILIDNHIQRVVCLLGDDANDVNATEEASVCRGMGIERFNDPLSGDGTGDPRSYADALTQIAGAGVRGEAVLVHCSSGTQRTNGTIYFYRVLVQHRDPDEAAAEMRRNGADPIRNPHLIPYLNTHIGAVARWLVQLGVIDHVPDPLPQIGQSAAPIGSATLVHD